MTLTVKKPPTGYARDAVALAAAMDYRRRRAAAYPSTGDQLDAIWKTIADLNPSTPEARDVLERIAAVRAAHPKPQPKTGRRRKPADRCRPRSGKSRSPARSGGN